MSEDSKDKILGFLDPILYWFRFPKPGEDHDDDPWHHNPIFTGDWVKVKNRKEWYESPHIVSIYEDHKKILNVNMEMSKPIERYYFQHVDNGGFRSVMTSDGDLPSSIGDYRIHTRLRTKAPPSGENNFGLIEYSTTLQVKYNPPEGITKLPRILARPLNQFFKWAYLKWIGEEVMEHDSEFAQEQLNTYFQYLRRYHGEEPLQSKTRQELYKPPTDEGTFFK